MATFLDNLLETAWYASTIYTSSYTKKNEKIDYTSPLQLVGQNMRKAMKPIRFYSDANPYAEVDIENPGRFSKDTSQVTTTNDVNKLYVDSDREDIDSNFYLQS